MTDKVKIKLTNHLGESHASGEVFLEKVNNANFVERDGHIYKYSHKQVIYNEYVFVEIDTPVHIDEF